MTWLDPQNPAFQSVIVPFALSFLLCGLILKTAGKDRPVALPVCAAALAVLAAYWMALSVPPFPPRAASQKLGYLLAASLALAVLMALRPDAARAWRGVVIAVTLGGLAWIAQSKLSQGQYGVVLAVMAGGGIALAALLSGRDQPVETGTSVFVAALGIAGIAIMAPSASLAQMALAIAAATGGFLLWTWPKQRFGFGPAGVMALAAPLIWLGGQAVLYSNASSAALAIAPLIAFAPVARKALARYAALENDTMRPVVTGLIAGVIAAVALLAAYASQTGQNAYGG